MFRNGEVWISFVRPEWLLLAPALWLILWWIARGRLGGWGGARSTALLMVRCAVVGVICAALAEPYIARRSEKVTAIIIRDESHSVPSESQRALDRFLNESVPRRKKDDRLALVTAARASYVQSLPSAGEPRLQSGYIGDRDGTDLASGLSLAAALVPGDTGSRLLLATDGNETQGDVVSQAREMAARKIVVDVLPLPISDAGGLMVDQVIVPEWTRAEALTNVRIVIQSHAEVTGRLTVLLNGEAIDLDPETPGLSSVISLTPGLNVQTVPIRLGAEGVQRLKAVFEPIGMTGLDPRLLSAETMTFTQTRGRIMVVLDDPDAAAPLINALRDEDVTISVVRPEQFPAVDSDLEGYDALVLVDQEASGFNLGQQEAMRRFVHDAGGGLLVVGGPRSFGAGGWIGSPLEDALPVKLDPPQKRQLPQGALAIVIDRSGSMAAPVANSGATQQQLANQAAILGINALSRLDFVCVVAFSGDAEVVVPIRMNTEPEAAARRIRAIGSGGGTNMFPAIDMAAEQLATVSSGIKHIIVLSDGETIGDPAEGIARAARLKRRNVTVSTVAIGDAANSRLMAEMARVGGGRFHPVTAAGGLASLPQIFIKEAQTVRRALIWEGRPFSPAPGVSHEAMRGIPGPYPALNGYVITADRGGLSSVVMRGQEGDPILASWQYGLGRAVAFASDATARWNSAWIAWSGFEAFWRQQLRWAMRPAGDPNARVAVSYAGDDGSVVIELFDAAGERVNFAVFRGRVAGPDGSSQELDIRQEGPGIYRGKTTLGPAGTYAATMRYMAPTPDGGVREGTIRAVLTRRASAEIAAEATNAAALEQVARITGGRVLTLDRFGTDLWTREGVTFPIARTAVWLVFALIGIGAFLADVAVRRVRIDPAAIAAALGALLRPRGQRATANADRLGAAKSRAREELARRSDEAAGFAAGVSGTGAANAKIAGTKFEAPNNARGQAEVVPPPVRVASPAQEPKPDPAKAAAPAPGDTLARLKNIKRRSGEDE